MSNIYLMCGVPASGKSTWANMAAEENGGIVISRDEIRYSLVPENENYFSKEDEVFAKFVYAINNCLSYGIENIYIDATHINKASRKKLLTHIDTNGHNLICEVFDVGIYELFARNLRRTGRAQVPEAVISKMYVSFEDPTVKEFDKFKFNSVTINTHKWERKKIDLDNIRSTF